MSGFSSRPTARLAGALRRWIPAIALGFSVLLPAGSNAQTRANLLLDVTVNEVNKRLVGNFIRDESGQIGAKASELEEVGIKPPGENKDPDAIVLLNSIPGITYHFDETRQSIAINAPVSALATQKLEVTPSRDPTGDLASPPQRNWGALANYTFYASGSRDLGTKTTAFNGASLNLETRAFTPLGTLSQTQIVAASDFSRQNTRFTRLDTTFTYSDPDTQITYRAGDTISGGLAWTRPVRMGGLQAQRSFGLRSDLITLPLPTLSGTAAVPSSVDLYINNLKTYSQDVATGPFQLNNLPSIAGSGTARLVVRDATGKEIEQSVPFFVSAKMLKAGLFDFSAEGGFARLNFAQQNFSYNRKPMASVSGRYGVVDWLTVDGHAEAMPGFGQAGLGVNVNTFGFGVLSLAGSASWFKREGMGAQVYGAYDFAVRSITIGLSAQRTFKAYNDLASVTAPALLQQATNLQTVAQVANLGTAVDLGSTKPARAIEKATVGIPISYDSSAINLSVARVVDGSGKQSKIAAASYSRKLPWNGSMFATAFVDFATAKKNVGLFAGVSFPFGEDISISSSASKSSGRAQFGLQASKSIKPEEGSYGWRVSDLEGGSPSRGAAIAYRSGFAQIEGGVLQSGRAVQGALSVDGAIVAAGGDVFLSPRVNDAFAVVDVGAPDVPIEYENRRVATTGRSGRALVPDLRSFQKNRISIDPTKLPLNASIASTRETVTPADRGAVVVNFGVQARVAGAIVKFVDAAGKPLKTGLAGKLNSEADFVVGYDGRAYLENLTASNAIAIEIEPGSCRAEFAYEARGDDQVVIGPVTCR